MQYRLVDLAVALPVLLVTWPIIAVLCAISTVDTRAFGLYRQKRIGKNGRQFVALKIRTMRPDLNDAGTVTVRGDARITSFGAFMRRFKLDELPQFWNVAIGTMSVVGPRPDVPGYADRLIGEDRVVLSVRPGITGPATLVFRDEETMLRGQIDPVAYNDSVIWPAKVAINRAFVTSGTIVDVVMLLFRTLRPNSDALVAMLQRWEPALLELEAVRSALGLNSTPHEQEGSA